MTKQLPQWVWWILRIVGALLVVIALVQAWGHLEYGPHPIVPHHRITITLPYRSSDELLSMIPMGETIAHPIKGGHPGIDFQWDHAVPLIAVANGTITDISRASDMGEPVWYLTLRSESYAATYKEMDTVAPGLAKGSAVNQGDLIGTPHCSKPDGVSLHCQLHWEFAYASPLPTITGQVDRLCPLSYFDPEALARITAAWAAVPAIDQFKAKFPDICSNVYRNHDQ